jgi:hypothetical protein
VVLVTNWLAGAVRKIVGDVRFKRRLIALEGEQVISLVSHDLVGDLDLAPP